MEGQLDRKKIVELFDELSKELRLEGARAQVYVIGGAAMSLAFDRERTTEDVDARTVYESAYLTVTGASAKHVLAMKLAAGRDKDSGDIRVLCEKLQLEDPEDAVAIYRELFPGEQLKATARAAVAAAFRDRSVERN